METFFSGASTVTRNSDSSSTVCSICGEGDKAAAPASMTDSAVLVSASADNGRAVDKIIAADSTTTGIARFLFGYPIPKKRICKLLALKILSWGIGFVNV
ncbi:hypothetical protein ACEN17_10285 [Corynebacterium rouxii]|uniref:hypothetical protein n=1 Tax=Corynebacterium rouxii TaxID=2719119 RepID=UPI00140D4BD0